MALSGGDVKDRILEMCPADNVWQEQGGFETQCRTCRQRGVRVCGVEIIKASCWKEARSKVETDVRIYDNHP